jgi:glycosyltransferase involved in cell wall biosynthesis
MMSDTPPVVSVIIPCFNAAAHLGDAISSVLQQSEKHIEVIVVDDGSTDASASLAASFGAKVRYLHQQNQGAASARNSGLQQARGQYIAFLDADDWWHPQKLEAQLFHLRNCSSCGAVYAHWQVCGSHLDPSWREHVAQRLDTSNSTVDQQHSGWLYHELLIDSVIHTSSILFRRQTIDRVGRFDESLLRGQDLDYWLRTSRISQVHRLPSVLSAYREYRGSATTRPTQTNYRALVVERAIASWGYAGPDGQIADSAAVQRVLSQSWQDFGYLHLRSGSPKVALQSFGRARTYGAASLKLRELQFRAWMKSLASNSATVLDARHKSP